MRTLSVLTLLSIPFLFGACTKRQPAPGASTPTTTQTVTSASTPTSADTILFGEVGSLTGSEASFGISTRNGIDLALREANAKGGVNGKKIAVRVYDNQGKPEESANAVTRLINQDKVVLILGEVASSNSLAMAPKAQEAKVPMISPSSTNPKVTNVGDYIFRVCFIDPFQGLAMAKFTRENLKIGTAAILRDNKSDYSLGLSDVFKDNFAKLGGRIVADEAYSKGDTDFRAQLTAIKTSKPDAIYVPGYYTDVGLIARQARELGIRVPLLGGDGWESEKLFELGGSALEGSYFTNHYSTENPNPRVQRFIETYKAAFGATPDSLAALGYDAAGVAIAALERNGGNTSGPAFRDAIAQTKDYDGVGGVINLDANRNAVKPAVVLQIKEGAAHYLTTVAP